MKLSYNRASSVARIAQSAGARIADVRGYGEVCLLLQIRQRTACKRTARLKLSAFVKGTKNDRCKNYHDLFVGCLIGCV